MCDQPKNRPNVKANRARQRATFIAAILATGGALSAMSVEAQEIVRIVPVLGGPPQQPVIQSTPIVQNGPATIKHLGNGPIDMNNLSPDILNCDVCRQRLGLTPLVKNKVGTAPTIATTTPTSPATRPNPAKLETLTEQLPPVRMLGSPGLISSLTADQMAKSGLVVEEFKPPQAEPNAIQLQGIPLEVRQQFLQSLELPFGAKVMSANVLGANKTESENQQPATAEPDSSPVNSNPVAEPLVPVAPPSIPAPPAVVAPADATPPTKPETPEPPKAESPADAPASKEANEVLQRVEAIRATNEELKKRIEYLTKQQATAQSQWQARLDQSDSANREVLSMLEKRTAEVSELQAQLQSAKEALANAKSEVRNLAKQQDKPRAPESLKKELKKKDPKKPKAPVKPTVET